MLATLLSVLLLQRQGTRVGKIPGVHSIEALHWIINCLRDPTQNLISVRHMEVLQVVGCQPWASKLPIWRTSNINRAHKQSTHTHTHTLLVVLNKPIKGEKFDFWTNQVCVGGSMAPGNAASHLIKTLNRKWNKNAKIQKTFTSFLKRGFYDFKSSMSIPAGFKVCPKL